MEFKAKVKVKFQGKTPSGEEKVFEKNQTVTHKDLSLESFEAAYVDDWLEVVAEAGPAAEAR